MKTLDPVDELRRVGLRLTVLVPAGVAQVLALRPAEGGFVGLTLPEAGHYPFVSRVMTDAERGARGVFEVAAAP